jgi:hypothetical protein
MTKLVRRHSTMVVSTSMRSPVRGRRAEAHGDVDDRRADDAVVGALGAAVSTGGTPAAVKDSGATPRPSSAGSSDRTRCRRDRNRRTPP